MATYVEVTCIRKSDRYNPHERIESIGGVNPNGTRWELDEDKAIAGIERGEWLFYVQKAGRRTNVVIARSATGHKYLKTEADDVTPNNLLSLATCPI